MSMMIHKKVQTGGGTSFAPSLRFLICSRSDRPPHAALTLRLKYRCVYKRCISSITIISTIARADSRSPQNQKSPPFRPFSALEICAASFFFSHTNNYFKCFVFSFEGQWRATASPLAGARLRVRTAPVGCARRVALFFFLFFFSFNTDVDLLVWK